MISEELALSKCANICSQSEHCISEIQEKLAKFEINDEAAKRIIDYLVKNKYIDEHRYANYYVRDKARFNGWGPTKIRFMLSQKRIDKSTIDESLKSLDSSIYEEKLLNILKNKIKTSHYSDNQKLKAALFRLGASRGFDYQVIGHTINKLLNNDEDN